MDVKDARSRQHGSRLNNPSHQIIAQRVYEIYVARGYVDQRDWIETAHEVKHALSRERAERAQTADPHVA